MQDKILEDLKTAMRAGDKERLEVLRMVKSALQMAEIDSKGSFDEAAQIKVVMKEAKKRRDAAKMFEEGGNNDRAAIEITEATIIEEYLPEMMSEAEIAKVVDETIQSVGVNNVGVIMGQVMGKLSGQADGNLVSKIVREKLQ